MTTKIVDNMEDLEEKLNGLGLSEKESDVYLAIVKDKITTVVKLARNTGIKRTSIYHVLGNLIKMGLVDRITKDDKSFYITENPKVSLKSLVREKERVVDAIIPELKNLFGKGSYQPEIKIYRSTSGLKKVLDDILGAKEKIARYYISSFNLEDLLGEKVVDEFVRKRIDLGIKSLSIRSFKYKPKRETKMTHAKQIREVKFIPENVMIKPYMCIYDDKVAVVSTREEKLGFIIQSKEFADAQKEIFDMIWDSVAI